MRKILSLVFAALLLGNFGCAPKGSDATKPNLAKKPKTIVIWHWMTDREDAFEKLAKRYKELTGVDVRFELYAPSDAYTQKVRGAAQTRDSLPDSYGILAEKRDFASFIKAGHILNLNPYMEANNNEWRGSFYKKALAVNEFLPGNEFGVEPGIYGVPIDVMNIQMLYNKDLFKKAGLDPENPPKTWSEFLNVGQKLYAAGIQGMVSGWGEIWMIDCLASNYAYNVMGEDKFIATIRGEVPYTDPDWIKVFALFEEMRDNHLLATGIVSMINKQAEQMFANERAALAFNGSWCVNVYYGMNPKLDYGVMFPPRYSDKYPMAIWGGAGSSFMVNPRSRYKEEMIQFLKWLTAKEQQVYLTNETHNLPANKDCSTEIPKVLSEFAAAMESTTHPNNLPVSEFPRVIETRNKGIQSIIIGEKTPEELALEIQAVKLKELQKVKS